MHFVGSSTHCNMMHGAYNFEHIINFAVKKFGIDLIPIMCANVRSRIFYFPSPSSKGNNKI